MSDPDDSVAFIRHEGIVAAIRKAELMTGSALPLFTEVKRPPHITSALRHLSTAGSKEERGAVNTQEQVVDIILDLVGYDHHKPLHSLRLLEPSFGNGDFLLPAVRRLLASYVSSGGTIASAADKLATAIVGIELHEQTFLGTRERVISTLKRFGLSHIAARQLADAWLTNDDFLLTEIAGQFDFIVGNPPYVRQERIPAALLKEYKLRYKTIYDRADLYVPFYERGLDLLSANGRLGYICSDRWTKNKYGAPLRQKITSAFYLECYLNLTEFDAFHSEVIAYPAITVLRRGQGQPTKALLTRPKSLEDLAEAKASLVAPNPSPTLISVTRIARGSDPWLLDDPHANDVIRHLEQTLPTLEGSQCRVTIGVATGCDSVFIGKYDSIPVERDRKLPLLMPSDISHNGTITWSGHGIVNPFDEQGLLVPLDQFPLLRDFFGLHESRLRSRHVAKKQPAKWYRTIDRIYLDLFTAPKLLIPDIKGDAVVAFDSGEFYPHHNLYVVTSRQWDLRALQAVMRSSIGVFFVASYCVRMSGGFLRFQAQYLRRIRLPYWDQLPAAARNDLCRVANSSDLNEIDEAVLPLYSLTKKQISTIKKMSNAARIRNKK